MRDEENWIRLVQVENRQNEMEQIIKKLDQSYKVNTIVYSLMFVIMFILSGVGAYVALTQWK